MSDEKVIYRCPVCGWKGSVATAGTTVNEDADENVFVGNCPACGERDIPEIPIEGKAGAFDASF